MWGSSPPSARPPSRRSACTIDVENWSNQNQTLERIQTRPRPIFKDATDTRVEEKNGQLPWTPKGSLYNKPVEQQWPPCACASPPRPGTRCWQPRWSTRAGPSSRRRAGNPHARAGSRTAESAGLARARHSYKKVSQGAHKPFVAPCIELVGWGLVIWRIRGVRRRHNPNHQSTVT